MNLFEKQARLNQLFAQNPVTTAYLAGSLASRASFGHLTDVDIAILLMDQIKQDQFLDYQLYFLSELARRLETEAIDVVILNQASLLLKLQVIKYGQILFSRDERQRIAFETRAVMQYLDFRRMDEIQSEALSRRLAAPTLTLDRETLDAQVQRLRKALAILQELRGADRNQFISDYHLHGLAERYLQVAIEGCLQMCGLLIASLGLRRPEAHHDLLTVVARRELIPLPLAFRLEVLADLRDLLVHEPEKLTPELLYEHLYQRLGDLEEFANAISKLIGGET
jgi:uncharacterized protein YutE (UPF0331/DUF86 family)/predicted nucleotidyltransferase